MEKIDLHLHSNLSDGVLSIQEIIDRCIKIGCKKIAITDHSKICDYSEESKRSGITIINGIEFSTSTKGMHILGYNLDNIDVVQRRLDELSCENEDACYKIIDALYRDGFDITVSSVLECMKEMGVSFKHLSKKHIIKYLVYKEYVKSMTDAYNMLTCEEGKYYYPLKKLSKYEVLELIKSNGGVSILAHPSSLYFSDYELEKEINNLISKGLDGIEIRNRSITVEQGIRYEQIANKLGILTTVGSDFHSPEKDTIGVDVSEEIYDKFKKRMLLAKGK